MKKATKKHKDYLTPKEAIENLHYFLKKAVIVKKIKSCIKTKNTV